MRRASSSAAAASSSLPCSISGRERLLNLAAISGWLSPSVLRADRERFARKSLRRGEIAPVSRDERQIVQRGRNVRMVRPERLSVDRQALPESGFGAREVSLVPENQSELVQARRGLVVLVSKRLSPDRQSFPHERFGAVVEPAIAVEPSELDERLRDVLVRRPEEFAPHGERLCEHRLGGGRLVLLAEQHAEVVQGFRHLGRSPVRVPCAGASALPREGDALSAARRAADTCVRSRKACRLSPPVRSRARSERARRPGSSTVRTVASFPSRLGPTDPRRSEARRGVRSPSRISALPGAHDPAPRRPSSYRRRSAPRSTGRRQRRPPRRPRGALRISTPGRRACPGER